MRPSLPLGISPLKRWVDEYVSKKKRFDYEQCVALMRKHDPQLQDDGFHALLPRAAAYLDALMADFVRETDHGVRCWLLELIGEARDSRAFVLLAEQLASTDDALRSCDPRPSSAQYARSPRRTAAEARKALFGAGAAKQTS